MPVLPAGRLTVFRTSNMPNTDPLGRTTTFTYDNKQNLLTQTNPLGKTWTYTYDSNGFQTSVRDPLGNTSAKVYNQFGGVLSVTDAAQTNSVTTSYDAKSVESSP